MFPIRIAFVLIGLAAGSHQGMAQDQKSPLVTRDRVRLNLAGAETVLGRPPRRRRPRWD